MRLSTGSGKKWDVEKDRFTAKVIAWDERDFKDDNGKPKKGRVLVFQTEKGETIERNSTTAWDRWFGLDRQGKGKAAKLVKVAPVLHLGDVVKILDLKSESKGKNRFYSFELDVLTGKDRPKWAQKS